MPKATATRQSARSKPTNKSPSNPYTKPARKTPKPKDPKQSHLYTDDNPATTLHGTGFKDAKTAHHTIDIVSQRSLTYQWQVINTMYHRAKNHPAMRKSQGQGQGKEGKGNEAMKEAIEIFEQWLSSTYPEAKQKMKTEGRDFKPLLKKDVVKRYLDRIRALESSDSDDSTEGEGESEEKERRKRGVEFAGIYVELPKGKRLANVLVNDEQPGGDDWDGLRRKELTRLRDERVEKSLEGEDGLWTEKGGASEWHLRCIAWAWSPVGERRLPP